MSYTNITLIISALCIHLSVSTACELKTYHAGKFEAVYNGLIRIRNLCNMETYWLLGKKEFSFKISVNTAAEIIENTSYFRQ